MGLRWVCLLGCAVALPILTSQAQSASLTLGCSGTATTEQVPRDGVAPDPEKESVVDFSVVVDLDRRTVSGFWSEMTGVHTPLPIYAVDANSVSFRGSKSSPAGTQSIEGTVDRVTGKIDAMETELHRNGSMTTVSWDLRCRPTRPLF